MKEHICWAWFADHSKWVGQDPSISVFFPDYSEYSANAAPPPVGRLASTSNKNSSASLSQSWTAQGSPMNLSSSSENGGVVLLGVTPSTLLYTSHNQPSGQQRFQSAGCHCLISVPWHRIHSGMAVKRPWMFIEKAPGISKAASHVPINSPTSLEVKHPLLRGLIQWALQVNLTSSIAQPYSSLTKTQRSCNSPVLTRCSWPPSPLFSFWPWLFQPC